MGDLSNEKLYDSYLAKIKETDEISFKLMGLVPLASGAGIFALLKPGNIPGENDYAYSSLIVFWLLGVFGTLITFFIYRWEMRNISTCKTFRDAAADLEPVSGAYRKIRDNKSKPKLLGIHFGKEQAERCIYIITIVSWLVMPFLKSLVYLSKS